MWVWRLASPKIWRVSWQAGDPGGLMCSSSPSPKGWERGEQWYKVLSESQQAQDQEEKIFLFESEDQQRPISRLKQSAGGIPFYLQESQLFNSFRP